MGIPMVFVWTFSEVVWISKNRWKFGRNMPSALDANLDASIVNKPTKPRIGCRNCATSLNLLINRLLLLLHLLLTLCQLKIDLGRCDSCTQEAKSSQKETPEVSPRSQILTVDPHHPAGFGKNSFIELNSSNKCRIWT